MKLTEQQQAIIRNALLLRISNLRNLVERMQDLGLHNDLEVEEELSETLKVLNNFAGKEEQL